ncbi:transglycosylase SLT domain-containing protein, partial [Corynebacterium lipophiloflavum]|uniref:lytic transglycosylase domain-containing protein n=1 Tax=Corynebacterium lipophiloflavum TaxID=161889 RepID=UPI0012FAE373
LATGVQWYWENGILVAWTALQNAANWMYTNVLQPVFQWIGDRWNDMSRVLDAGRAFIVDTVFGGLQRGLDVVKDAFRVAPDAIGEAWEGVKAKTAVPVKFVIQTVFNEGIVEAWNKVAGWVGLEKIDKYEPEWLGSFAEGTSRVPGARTKHDNVHMMSQDGKFGISLRGGESVLVPEVTDALGPDKIDGMNAAAKMGGTKGVMRYLGGFAGGGVIGSITGLVNRFYPGMSITSTLRPGDPGWHGKGKAVDFSNGTDSTPQMRSAAEFFFKNYGPALLELIHSPFGNNVKNGQNVGDGFGLYGAGTMNAHRNHVHIAAAGPLPEPGDPITPVPSGGGGGGGVVNWLRDKVADALDGIFGPIGKAIPELPGVVGKLPRAAFDKMTGAVSNFIRGKADASGAYQGPVGSGVEQWRGLVESILQAKGFPTSLTDTVLRRMNQESGGNPRAINNWDINAKNGVPSKGLMQVIDPTFAANKDPGYNDIWDPESNIRASMNYAVRQYGSLPAAYNRAGGYHKGGLAPAGKGILHKTALEPEMVLNPDMTQAFIDWMGGTPHGESAAVVARELRSAFIGGDWGYGELASYIGEEMAKATVDVVAAIGRADRGFREWASATEEHDRMATPAEWAQHFGQQAGVALADDALGLVGLGGLIGKPLRGSFVDLVNAAVPLANDAVAGTGSQFRFGTLSASALQPVALLDDEGRRTGTKLAAAPTLADAEPATPLVSSPPPSVATTAPQVDNTPASGTTAPGAKNVIVLEGGKVYPAEELEKLNGRVDDVEVRVKKVEENQVADVTAGVSLMV